MEISIVQIFARIRSRSRCRSRSRSLRICIWHALIWQIIFIQFSAQLDMAMQIPERFPFPMTGSPFGA